MFYNSTLLVIKTRLFLKLYCWKTFTFRIRNIRKVFLKETMFVTKELKMWDDLRKSTRWPLPWTINQYLMTAVLRSWITSWLSVSSLFSRGQLINKFDLKNVVTHRLYRQNKPFMSIGKQLIHSCSKPLLTAILRLSESGS